MEEDKKKKSLLNSISGFYDKNYKILLIIPFLLLILSITSIAVKYVSEGEFINKDVSLKGGVTLTLITDNNINIEELETKLLEKYPEKDLEIRTLKKLGEDSGTSIILDLTQDEVPELIKNVEEITKIKLTKENYTIQVVGSSLGSSFFREVARALLIAFFFMGAVVSLYFGPNLKFKIISLTLALVSSIMLLLNKGIILDITAVIIGLYLIYLFIKSSIPSFAVILAAFSDIIVTLAIVNILGIKLSTAGIAAFLMLIGYSVDTDILLSTRVLKRKNGSVMERIKGAFKTGITMTLTTLAALSIAYIFTQSEVIKQIMTILLIGLFVDVINTWLQNAGILKLYLEKKKAK